MAQRIHLFGASGSGTTTLGRALAERLQAPHLDTDDFYWQPTDPPFREKRLPAERIRLIERAIVNHDSWVLSGSLCSWGDPLMSRFTSAVFLTLDPAVRMARLRQREHERYGDRIQPGCDMYQANHDFLEWAESYDTASAEIRSLAMHTAWIKTLNCPTIHLDSTLPAEELVLQILEQIGT